MNAIDVNIRPNPSSPDYPLWVAKVYINNLISHFPNHDIQLVVYEQTEKMPYNVRNIVRKVATDMFFDGEI